MKYPSQLCIKLESFNGCQLKIDYWFFKSEFEKWIISHVHTPLLADHFKENNADGQAYQVMKEINDLDSTWESLKQAYCDVENLMIVKLTEFDKGYFLVKEKVDPKVSQAIIKTENFSIDHKTFAKKRNVRHSFYHCCTSEV